MQFLHRAMLLGVFGAATACGADLGPPEVPALSKLSPATVSDAGAWRLFDRSIGSGFVPAGPIRVAFDRAAQLAALKVHGPAPYVIDVRDGGGQSLGFESIDLSRLTAGWHVVVSDAPSTTREVELRFHPAGASAAIPELELWAVSEPRDSRAAERLVTFSGDHAGDDIAPGTCVAFDLPVSRDPALLRRTRLVYQARGVLRPFALGRSINGRLQHGGAWLGADGSPHEWSDEIDPAVLHAGDNEVRLCLPSESAGTATIANLRLVGELDDGAGLASTAQIGPDRRDGAKLLDGEPATTVAIAAGERVALGFERSIAPDAIELAGKLGEVAFDCVDRGGDAHPLTAQRIATADGARFVVDGGALACGELGATFRTAATLSAADVVGSGAAERVDWPRIVVTSALEHFGARAWVGGFIARPPAMTGAIRIAVAGQPADAMTGEFGQLIERAGDPAAPWRVAIGARFPDGTSQTRELVLGDDSRDAVVHAATASGAPASAQTTTSSFGEEGDAVSQVVSSAATSSIFLGTQVGVDISLGAVAQPTTITVRHLDQTILPPLDPGMINVTAPGAHGYEFTPHGQQFLTPVTVTIPFDPQLVPQDIKLDDVRTFFYDPVDRRWKQLPRTSVDTAAQVVRSTTDHFTVMIDAVLAVPKEATPLSLDPTALTSIGAAAPGANIDLVEPPSASPTGDARLALPIRVPKGRGAYTPSLGIGYASSSGNGWLGVGWDVAISKVEIDTRWGVPTYADASAPRYLLDGAELVPTLDADGPSCTTGTTHRYHTRIEGAFSHILRCGDDVADQHWEVHNGNGVLSVYGDAPDTRLASYEGTHTHFGIFRWNLARVVDVRGNTTAFHYQLDEDTATPEPSRELYPASIEYAGGAYAVSFELDSGARPDRTISGRAGFKIVTRHLLRAVHVAFRGQIIRDYVLTYAHGQFDKSVLASVKLYGVGGCAAGPDAFAAPACAGAALFDEHTFDYFHDDEGFTDPVAWQVQGDPSPSTAALGKGATSALSANAGVTIGEKGELSASAGVNGSFGGRKELIGMYDVNGDGLPDQVFDTSGAGFFDELLGNDDGSISVLYNQTRPGIDPATTPLFAASSATISGLKALGAERQTSWGVSARANVSVAEAGAGFSDATSRARRFLGDLDGDGFVDLINADGTPLRSQPCATGTCFSTVAYGALGELDPRTDPVLRDIENDVKSRLSMADPVVQWVAPFDGRITVSGTAHKLHDGGADGVTVEAYHDDHLLDAVSIGAQDTTARTVPEPTTIDVTAGEAIYLRVKTGADDAIAPDGTPLDLVDARLSIRYVRACTPLGCGDVADPIAAHEPTGAPVFAFDSHDDFRVAGMPAPLVVLANGTLELHAQLVKPAGAAPVRACVQRFTAAHQLANPHLDRPCSASDADVTNVSGTFALAAETAVTQPLELSLPVEAGQAVMVRVESDLSIDPAGIALRPSDPAGTVATYSQVCVPAIDGSGFACSTDPEAIARVPLPLASFGPFVAVSSEPPAIPFVVPDDGFLMVSSLAAPSGPFVFAVRSDRAGILELQDCTATSCNSLDAGPFLVSAGESLTFELVTASGGPSAIEVFFDPDHRLVAPLNRRAFAPAAPDTPFAGGYRGFRAAFWNEAVAFAPAQLLADLADPLVSLDRKKQIARTISPPTPSFGGSPITGGVAAWIAPASAAYVSAAGLVASWLGLLQGAGTGADAGGVYANKYARLSGTLSFFLSAGLVSTSAFNVSLDASASSTNTTTDVVDMNGDGISDVVSTGQTILGTIGSLFADAGKADFTLDDDFRHRSGHEYAFGFGGKAVVRRTRAGGHTVDVDNPEGPDTGFLGLSAGRGLAIGRTQTTKDLLDVNGDGLPDLVERSGATVKVRLNLGGRFGEQETFGQAQGAMLDAIDPFESVVEDSLGLLDSTSDALTHETTITTNESGGFNFKIVACSHSSKHTTTRITRMLGDINGDGLPDLLFKKSGEARIRVQLNRGGDFGPVIDWPTTDGWPVDLGGASFEGVAGELVDKIQQLSLTGANVLAGTGSQDASSNGCSVSIPIYAEVSIDGGASESQDRDTYELGLMDIDGDGAADHVLRRGPADAQNIFVKHNRVTGKANLLNKVHRPLGGTVTLDYTRVGHSVDLPHTREVLTRIDVDDGVDLGAGFDSPDLVTTIAYDGGLFDRREKEFLGFARVTATRADGVTVEDTYENRSFALHGRLLSETRRDSANRMFQQHTIAYATLGVLGPDQSPVQPDPSCLAHLHPLLGPDACTPSFAAIVRDDDTRAEGGTTRKTHSVITDPAAYDRFGNVLASTDLGDDAIASDDIATELQYANNTARWILGRTTSLLVRAGPGGAILRARTGEYNDNGELIALHVDTGTGIATTTLGYDGSGNLDHVATPPDEAGQVQIHDITFDPDVGIYPVTMTDAFGYTSTASYDLRFGVATTEVDISGARLSRTLDAFGRIATVRGPYDTAAPALTMEYHPDESPPRAVTVTRPSAPPDYTGPIPAPTTTVTFGDGIGRTVELRKTAVVDGVLGMTTSSVVALDVAGRVRAAYNPFFTPGTSTGFVPPVATFATQMTYDALDRPVTTSFADGATETTTFDIATAPGGAQLFVSRAQDPNGHARETYLDHAGRTRVFVEHPTATTASVTSYDYLATGELSRIVDAENHPTQLGYDLRGLRTSLANPDDGLIEDRYDLMGNRIAQIQPNHRALGTQVHYVFERDRLASIDYPSKPDVAFTYGPPGAPSFAANRIVQVTDETGSQQHEYGALGELRRTIRTVVQQGRSPFVFDLHVTLDSLGRQLRIGYPDGEVVTNTYDAAGMLAAVNAQGTGWSRTYASDLRYDVFGNRTRWTSGNGAATTVTYDPRRIRLSQLVTTIGGAKIQDLRYTYDPANNPRTIANVLDSLTGGDPTMPGPSTLTLTYDGVDRLVESVGSADLGARKSTTYDQTFVYSASHNLLHKDRVHRVINSSGVAQNPPDTNFSSDYTYTAMRPHLPTQIGDLGLTYDPSGNPIVRKKIGTGAQQNLTWDDDNRLVDFTGSGTHQHSTYDASGLRVIRKSIQSETIFSSPYFDLENGTQGVKHVFAGATRIASELTKFTSGTNPIAPSKPGTAYFFHADQLRSTHVITDDSGKVHESLEYFSDGEEWIDRGPQKPVNGFLFSGKPFDPDTGLYEFGQRYYDPRTSLWLGVDRLPIDDPSVTVGKPVLLAPAAYAAHSPAARIDPDGRCPICIGIMIIAGIIASEETEGEPELTSAQIVTRTTGGVIMASAPGLGATVGTGAAKAIGGGALTRIAVSGVTGGTVATVGQGIAQGQVPSASDLGVNIAVCTGAEVVGTAASGLLELADEALPMASRAKPDWVYRAPRPGPYSGPPNPHAAKTVGEHVYGTRKFLDGSNFESWTSDRAVAEQFARARGTKLVRIDLNKVPKDQIAGDLRTAAGRDAAAAAEPKYAKILRSNQDSEVILKRGAAQGEPVE